MTEAAETVSSQDVATFFFVGDINAHEAQLQSIALMFSSYTLLASIVQSLCLKSVEVIIK